MKILHCYLHASSFVKKDDAIFRRVATVSGFEFAVSKKILLPLVWIRQLFFILHHGWTTDVFINQFAGYHSLLPCLFAKLTGKRSIIIAGGTDCVSFPGIGYGNFNRTPLREFTKWSFQLCSDICPKHHTLWHTGYTYDSKEPTSQGIKAHIPDLADKVTVIHNGYDPEKWPQLELPRRKNSFITVSGAFEYPFQVELKGIDLILKTAASLPDCTFTIVGVPEWKKLDITSENIIVVPPVKNENLYTFFNEHEFYIQVSMAEGFPNALCEAMLCGCTPVVSNVFSMPEIVGNSENVLTKRDHGQLTELLKKMITQPASPAENRNRISQNYTEQHRAEKLISLLNTPSKSPLTR